jgi:hypothetical protein
VQPDERPLIRLAICQQHGGGRGNMHCASRASVAMRCRHLIVMTITSDDPANSGHDEMFQRRDSGGVRRM